MQVPYQLYYAPAVGNVYMYGLDSVHSPDFGTVFSVRTLTAPATLTLPYRLYGPNDCCSP
jgi:hypothetical protein